MANDCVLVLGGSGFVGSHVADALVEAGYSVRIFDQKESPYIREGQEMIVGDLLDFDQVVAAADGARYIYNFAGLADIDDAKHKPLETAQVNVIGNIHALQAARDVDAERFLYAS